jgi:hypothetical protein
VESLSALIRNSPRDQDGNLVVDEPTRETIDEILSSRDKNDVLSILPLLVEMRVPTGGRDGGNVAKLHRIESPIAEHLLFAPDPDISLQARRLLKYYNEKSAAKLLPQLMEVIQAKDRGPVHVAALRALAALGTHAKKAAPEIRTLLMTTDDDAMRLAAAVALLKVQDKPITYQDLEKVLQLTSDSTSKEIVANLVRQRDQRDDQGLDPLQQEEMKIAPPENRGGGGGGFF